ncbi:MAG: DHA2 family efflux MFS transporter permease subunit [Sinobacteraceae bacterium]|nr:DHA2 family efflux MFS transporter permease subunit [Nevskiaceae bacterium]
MAATAAPAEAGRPGYGPLIITLVVALGAFMEVLDISIANVSLPHIAGSLSADTDQASWVLTSYLVTNAIVMPITGWLSNTFGRRRVYLFCIAGFTLSSFLCGLAPNLATLVVLRAIQGATGGGLQPSAQAIMADQFPASKQGMAMSIYGIAVVFAPAIGPTLGGWITDNFSWRWVFLVNVPVGIMVFALIAAMVRDPQAMREAVRNRGKLNFDGVGFGLVALALGCLQVALDRGQQADWFSSNFITIMVLLSVGAFVGLIVWELRQKHPIINLKLFRDRNFSVMCLFMLMLGFMLLGTTYLIPIFVQKLMGYTATWAGLIMTPGGLTIMFMMPIAGWLTLHVDLRAMILVGFVLTGLATLHMTNFYPGMNVGYIVWARIFQALGLAFMFIPINSLAFAKIPRSESSNASGLINLARNLGASVGISMVTLMVARRSQFHQTVLVSHVNDYKPHALGLLDGASQLFAGTINSGHAALASVYHQVLMQAQLLSYLDVLKAFAILFFALIPLLLLIREGRIDDSERPEALH